MSGADRQPYLTATALDQALLDACADNLETRLEMICVVQTPVDFIYASDRNKYIIEAGVGKFYEALMVFPVIMRTLGEWLSPEIQFSPLQLTLSNVDGRFNRFLPGGADFASWINLPVIVRLGLADLGSSYTTIYSGQVTEFAGLKRSPQGITISTRDRFDTLNVEFPKTSFKRADYPKIKDDVAGKLKPVIYGDFTTALDPAPAIVPAFIVNGADPFADFKPRDVDISIASPAIFTSQGHCLDNNDKIQFQTTGSLPTGLTPGLDYYVKSAAADTFEVSLTMGGSSVNTSGSQSGSHTFTASPTEARVNLQCVISETDLLELQTDNVWLRRSDLYYRAPSSEVVSVGAGNKSFELKQSSGGTWIDGAPFEYQNGDLVFVRVKGKDLGAYSNNIVWQARDILMSLGGLGGGDFDANWATYRDKATPAQSAIANIPSRVWEDQKKPIITYALSMLEQVRLEAFVSRQQTFKLNSLHFEDWPASPTYVVRNWDVIKDTWQPQLDERNNFNRAQAAYDFHPDANENARATVFLKNTASITQVGKTISKRLTYPNLYVESDVLNQLTETLRIASAMPEMISCQLTWRSALKELGDFVKINVSIGGTIFENVPAMIRDLGYDPAGLKLPVRLWSFQMVPYGAYAPGYAGTVGGSAATIVTE